MGSFLFDVEKLDKQDLEYFMHHNDNIFVLINIKKSMGKYKCLACGYIYDEEKEEIKFEDLPENWVCPLCGVPKSMFEKVEE